MSLNNSSSESSMNPLGEKYCPLFASSQRKGIESSKRKRGATTAEEKIREMDPEFGNFSDDGENVNRGRRRVRSKRVLVADPPIQLASRNVRRTLNPKQSSSVKFVEGNKKATVKGNRKKGGDKSAAQSEEPTEDLEEDEERLAKRAAKGKGKMADAPSRARTRAAVQKLLDNAIKAARSPRAAAKGATARATKGKGRVKAPAARTRLTAEQKKSLYSFRADGYDIPSPTDSLHSEDDVEADLIGKFDPNTHVTIYGYMRWEFLQHREFLDDRFVTEHYLHRGEIYEWLKEANLLEAVLRGHTYVPDQIKSGSFMPI